MNKINRTFLFLFAGVCALFFLTQNNAQARDITIVGEINDYNELVSSEDGTVYELSECEIAGKLVYEHRGEKMRVFGKLIKPVQEYSVDERPKGLIEVIRYEDVPE